MLTGILLAAGRGSRLARGPKALVPVGGKRLLDWIVAGFEAARVDNLLVVTGSEPHLMDDAVSDVRSAVPMATSWNPDWDVSNNAVTLAHGVRETLRRWPATTRLLASNSDIIAAPHAFSLTAATAHDLHLAVEFKPDFDGEEMCFGSVDGRPALAKKLLNPTGEFIGVSAFNTDFAGRYLRATAGGTNDNRYYEDVFDELLTEPTHLGLTQVLAEHWAEVDMAEDLERAMRVAQRLEDE